MNKTLIVGATSDLASNYISNQSSLDEFVFIVRNLKKMKSIFPNKKFNDVEIIDLSKINDVYDFFNTYSNNFSKIIFFNGIDIIKPVQFYKIEDIVQSFNINVISIFIIISKLLKSKSISKNSSIIIVSSISGNIVGSKGHSLYSTTKASITGLVKSLALELSTKKIRVNSILPGLVKTNNLFNKNQEIQNSEDFEKYEDSYPLGFGKPKNINDIIDFLLGNESEWITGQNIIIDGGHTLL